MTFTEFAKIDAQMTSDFDSYSESPHIGIESIQQNTGHILNYKTVKEDAVKSGKYVFTSKHIIYSKIRPNLNKVATPDFDGLCSADAYPILPKFKVVRKEFLAFILRSSIFLDYIIPFSRRTGMPKVNREQVEGFQLHMPPLPLQDEFLTISNQADKSKFDGFKSQFIEMFDSVESFSALENIVSDTFPGEWGNEPTSSNAIKVIRTTNFTNEGRLDLSEVVTREIDSKKVSRKKLNKGDTILERSGGTKDNPVGRVVFFDEGGDYLFNNFTQVLRPKENVNPVYLFYSLYNSYNLNKAAMRAMASQTTGIQNLSMSDYMAKQIKLPSKKLQDKFESIYRQADKSKYYVQK